MIMKNPQESKIMRTPNGGLIQDFARYLKLIWRLMKDRRVNIFFKILPVAALVYLVSPIDLISGLTLPIIGALDDAAIVWVGTSLFIGLCPENVVEEHRQALEKVITGTWQKPAENDEVVDVESRDVTDEVSNPK
jgi:uncharacterized membrane protein YkvA (DUF1232 family)